MTISMLKGIKAILTFLINFFVNRASNGVRKQDKREVTATVLRNIAVNAAYEREGVVQLKAQEKRAKLNNKIAELYEL